MVKDSIIWLNVINTDGEIRKVAAEEGESMLMALRRMNTPGLPALCGGGDPESPPYLKPFDYYSWGPMCNTCQVNIPMEWNSKIPKSNAEKEELEGTDHVLKSTSRLSCCIQMEKWMDGMTVEISENTP